MASTIRIIKTVLILFLFLPNYQQTLYPVPESQRIIPANTLLYIRNADERSAGKWVSSTFINSNIEENKVCPKMPLGCSFNSLDSYILDVFFCVYTFVLYHFITIRCSPFHCRRHAHQCTHKETQAFSVSPLSFSFHHFIPLFMYVLFPHTYTYKYT